MANLHVTSFSISGLRLSSFSKKNGEKYLDKKLKEGLTLGWGDRHFSLVKVIRVKRNLKS